MSLNKLPTGLCCLLMGLLTTQGVRASEVVNESRTISAGLQVQEFFGYDLAVDGQYIIGGAYGANVTTGNAYLFDRQTGANIGLFESLDRAPYDSFGLSVSLSGHTALIGAHGNDDAGNTTGSAYLFDAVTGTQIAKLLPSDATAVMSFGYDTAISGSTALIGAQSDSPSGQYSGSAYLFDATSGAQWAKLTAPDASAGDRFGWSVAIDGGLAIVGAPDDDNRTGAIYLFDVTNPQQPLFLDKITAQDKTPGDRFGESVAISNDSIVVGASATYQGRGAAYIFDRATGQQISKTNQTGASRNQLGTSVDIQGDFVVVGGTNNNNWPYPNSAYVFDRLTGEELFHLVGTDIQNDDGFGQSVAIQGSEVFVGAWEWNNDRGRIYVFDIPEPASSTLIFTGAFSLLLRGRCRH
jgi:hypothetical protein